MPDLPLVLDLHYRNGERLQVRITDRTEPPDVIRPEGGPSFRLGSQAKQFVHLDRRETLCRVARYWEEVTA